MFESTRKRWFCLFTLSFLFHGCDAIHDVGENLLGVRCASDDACGDGLACDTATGACARPPRVQDVDILFLIDNSPSMAPKQAALARAIPAFIRRIDSSGANYHVGIATSDVGTNVAPGTPWGGSVGSCDTFEGDDGVLQNVACTTRVNVTSEARTACTALCPDPKYLPTDGKRFISKTAGVTNVPKDVRLDPVTGKMVDFGPINAFDCMALVGDGGCGVEGQFEGAKRALDGHRSENAGFLRSNSLLAVIFITDEDDCSVQAARRSENNPSTRDCASPDKNASYECFNMDYRCQARALDCAEPLNTAGAKTACAERASSYLEPVQRYVTFLSGLRPRSKLFVSGIWTLPPIDKSGLSVSAVAGGTATPFLNRDRVLCAAEPAVSGMPQLRLSKLAGQFRDSVQVNLCDTSKYPDALDAIARAIVSKAGLSEEL